MTFVAQIVLCVVIPYVGQRTGLMTSGGAFAVTWFAIALAPHVWRGRADRP